MTDTTNHTPRKTYRLSEPIVAALNEGVRRGLAVNQTGAVVAAVVAWAEKHGIEIGIETGSEVESEPKKPRKKSADVP